MVCLNRMVPTRNSSGPPIALSDRPEIGMAVRMRQHEFVGHRRDDDAGHDRHMQIGVGEPRQPARFAGFRDLLGAGFGALVEIDPPHRDAADEGRQRRPRRLSAVQVRSAKVAPVTTMDSPSAMMMKPAQRSAMWPPSTTQSATDEAPYFGNPEPHRRRDIFDPQRHRPQRQPRLALGKAAGDPEHGRHRQPDQDADRVQARQRPAVRRRDQQKDGAADLHRGIGEREPQAPRLRTPSESRSRARARRASAGTAARGPASSRD